MNVEVTDIIAQVKTAIDEIAANDAEWVAVQDNSEMDTIIAQKIPEAVDFVHRTAKYELLAGDVVKTAKGTADSTRPVIIISGGILRFISALCDSWPWEVTKVYTKDEDEYASSLDKWCGASVDRPAVLMQSPTKFMFVEAYAGDDISMDYIEKAAKKTPGDETDGDTSGTVAGASETVTGDYYEIDGFMVTAVIYYIAGLVCMTYNEERADTMFGQAMAWMGVEVKK